MKRSLVALIPLVAIATALNGCGGKEESGPVNVKDYSTYADEILKFSVRYPTNWAKGVQAGTRAVFYSSQAVAEGFGTYDPQGQRGAKVDVAAMVGGQAAMDKSIADLREPFTDPKVFKEPEQVTFNGMPATKISYSFDLEDTRFTAERYYVMKDSVVSYLETAVIGDYNSYAAVFDTARASFVPGSMIIRTMPTDTSGGAAPADTQLVEAPSATAKGYSGSHFNIQYPSNFSPGTARAGGAMASMTFSGARNDSYFQVDVIDPKGMSLDQIVEQNKRNYGGRAASAASVGGQKGFVFNYSGGQDVSSRAYFVMANSKLYRITVNWYKPQQELYLPAFEKALGSFQAK